MKQVINHMHSFLIDLSHEFPKFKWSEVYVNATTHEFRGVSGVWNLAITWKHVYDKIIIEFYNSKNKFMVSQTLILKILPAIHLFLNETLPQIAEFSKGKNI